MKILKKKGDTGVAEMKSELLKIKLEDRAQSKRQQQSVLVLNSVWCWAG